MSSISLRGTNASEFITGLDELFSPYFDAIPRNSLEYSYMSSSGAGTSLCGAAAYEQIRSKNISAMRKHFRIEDVAEVLTAEHRALLIELVPDGSELWRLQEDAGSKTTSSAQQSQIQRFNTNQSIKKFVASQYLSKEELRELVHQQRPELGQFLDQLDSTKALWFNANTVGYLLAKEELAARFPGSPFVAGLAAELHAILGTE